MAKFLGIFLVVLTVLIVFDVGPLYAQEAEAEINPDCDPFLGGLASFVIPGWGQWLNGEKDKALVHITVGMGLSVTAFLLRYPFSLVVAGVRTLWGLYSTFDAFSKCASQHELGMATQ